MDGLSVICEKGSISLSIEVLLCCAGKNSKGTDGMEPCHVMSIPNAIVPWLQDIYIYTDSRQCNMYKAPRYDFSS